MPTTRPRHLVTETDQVAAALDAASERWPEDQDSRARLLVRLVEEGHRALRTEHSAAIADRQDAVRRTAGLVTGAYEKSYLQEMREDWPT